MNDNATFTKQQIAVQKLIRSKSSESVNSCWIWSGNKDPGGYGREKYQGKTKKAHNLSWAAWKDAKRFESTYLQDRLVIRHLCNQRSCVNPEHLQIGTCAENSADRLGAGTLPKGEKNPACKITADLARLIHASSLPKTDPNFQTKPQRAKLFGVSLHIVQNIDSGKTWKHLGLQKFEWNSRRPASKKCVTKHTSAYHNVKYSETLIKQIIASRFQMNHCDYQTQKQRSLKFGVPVRYIGAIDTNKTWQYLPRPKIEQTEKLKIVYSSLHSHDAAKQVYDRCEERTKDNFFDKSPCYDWKGNSHSNRPMFCFGDTIQRAYTFVCEYKYSRLKKIGEIVRHLCGNSMCCRMEHIEFSDEKTNSADVKIHRPHMFKLNYKIAQQIREEYKSSTISHAQLAKKYDVGPTHIHSILSNKSWTSDHKIEAPKPDEIEQMID